MPPGSRPTEVVMDFEQAEWRAFPQVFPSVVCRGCSFHWGQAIQRNVAEKVGKKASKDRATLQILDKVKSLQYIPAEQIPMAFDIIKIEVEKKALNEPG